MMKLFAIFVKMPMAAIIVTQFLKPKVIHFHMDKFTYLQQQYDFRLQYFLVQDKAVTMNIRTAIHRWLPHGDSFYRSQGQLFIDGLSIHVHSK